MLAIFTFVSLAYLALGLAVALIMRRLGALTVCSTTSDWVVYVIAWPAVIAVAVFFYLDE